MSTTTRSSTTPEPGPGEAPSTDADPGSGESGSGLTGPASTVTAPGAWAILLPFLRLGVTAFGGPAIVAYIRDLAVKKKHWLSGESFGDGLALCQTIPGATAMQSAAYVGLKTRGFSGAAAAYLGFGAPAFVLMLALSVLYKYGQEAPLILSLFSGLRAMVVALIANAALNIGITTVKKWWGIPVVAGAAAALYFGVHPIYVILAAAVVGMALPGATQPQPQYKAERGAETAKRSFVRPAAVLVGVSVVVMGVLFAVERPLFQLALTMLRVDLFAFGGGFAAVPLMQNEVVNVHHWLDTQTFIDGIALGQVTPGPIVITATFVGYMVAGFAGAVVATAAIFLPSFTVLVLVEPYFDRLKRNRWFRRAIAGILLSFVGLLVAVAIRLGLSVSWQVWTIALAVATFAALRLKVDVLWVVLAGGVISVVMGLL